MATPGRVNPRIHDAHALRPGLIDGLLMVDGGEAPGVNCGCTDLMACIDPVTYWQ